MDKWVKRAWWVVLGVILVIAVLKFILPVNTPVKIEQSLSNREIVVYVTGAVSQPGLINLPIDARLDDALKKAGLTNDADVEALNPAQKLKDGQKILVPYKPQIQISGDAAAMNPVGSTSFVQGSTNTGSTNTIVSSGKTASGTNARVNINLAGLSELDTIPGIGPAIAQRIVDYREQHGLFSSVEEIQEVSGIGPKTFEKMAAYITIGR